LFTPDEGDAVEPNDDAAYLFANPNCRERRGFPFIVDLQANVVEVEYRIVAPLAVVWHGA
jgi:hypothetical protein